MHFSQRLAGILALGLAVALCAGMASGEIIRIPGSSDRTGLMLTSQDLGGVTLLFEMSEYGMEPVEIDGEMPVRITLPGVILPNDAGAPDLPGLSNFIAVPNGAAVSARIVSVETQTRPGVDVAPAFVIPRETDDSPLIYERNPEIYGRSALYPAEPLMISERDQLRGVDYVIVGVTPFQYNPVSRDLVVHTRMEIRLDFVGGDGTFGEERLRSRHWEPILAKRMMNYQTMPPVDFSSPRSGDRSGWEYVIIAPDNPDFLAWADTLKTWRQLQGISTEVFTTTQAGGNTASAIRSFLADAYNTWDPAPAAFLILGDWPQHGYPGVTSPIHNGYCVSDNMFADVTNNHMPDMFHGRITGRTNAELQTMITKMLDYERNPVMDASFYDVPLFAGGWQTERWFILCSEVCLGFKQNVLGKTARREYSIYSGTPGSVWSTATNTGMMVNYFGPNGLGYIPATPQHLTDWGANSVRMTNAINEGTYILLHRDHGNTNGWGQPDYRNHHLANLANGNKLPYVFSINCLTGKYNHSSDSFTEVFHRMAQGALGVNAASEISYSFVNDTYVWGMWDSMWPEFMPAYGQYPPYSRFSTNLRPAIAMAAGKYFLQASNWPWNTNNKLVTYHLFHHHGDAFMTIYSEVPRPLAVTIPDAVVLGTSSITMQAEEGAVIGLTVDGVIVGTADATGHLQSIPIVPSNEPGELRITVVKDNCFRFDERVPIIPPDGPYLVFDGAVISDPAGNNNGIPDAGETILCGVRVKNVGTEIAQDVVGTLTSSDPYIVIHDAQAAFPDIPEGGTMLSLDEFSFTIHGNAPDGHRAVFSLLLQGNGGDWVSGFEIDIHAPVLAFRWVQVLWDSGNNNGQAEPGETCQLAIWLENTGRGDSPVLEGVLRSLNPHIAVLHAQGAGEGIEAGGEGSLSAFTIEVSPECAIPSTQQLRMTVSSDNGLSLPLDIPVDIGPWFDDAEDCRGWTLGAPDDDATTGLWIRDVPIGTWHNNQPVQPDHQVTPGGEKCFVTGNAPPGSPVGTNDVDDGKTTLISPVFQLGEGTQAVFSYWRWYTNDLGNNPMTDWWTVDVTNDGETWVHLERTMESMNSWNQFSFNLTDYIELTDHVQVRFIAEDYDPPSLVEAAVDDIMMDVWYATVAAPEMTVQESWGFVSLAPNPMQSGSRIVYRLAGSTRVDMALFDVSGRRVRTLVHGLVEAGVHDVQLETEGARPLPSGVYFLRLHADEVRQTRRITILR